MKYIKTAFAVFSVLLMLSSVAFASDVEVYIDGREITFEEQPPIIQNDKTLVPLRAIFEELGAYVDWIKETRTVYATRRFSYVMMQIGSDTYWVNGEEKKLDVPASIVNERTLVPVRAVSEALGCKVDWDKENRRVIITSKQGEIPVKDMYINYSDNAENGTVLFTGRAAYPVLSGNSEIITAMNEYILGDVEEAIVRARAQCYYSALESYENSLTEGYEFLPYMAEHSFDITYNKDNLISILCTDCNFAGWTHPDYMMYAMTYDLDTGKAVGISELLRMTDAEIEDAVFRAFEKLIEETPEAFYHDALLCLEESLSELKWYLAEDGVHFFINPYEIAPYAAGVIETVLPIKK